MDLTATCGRDENEVRVRERLQIKITFFFSKYLFCILISLSQNHLENLIKKYVLSEGEQFPLSHTFADSHYVFTSTTGGGLLRNPMSQPLNGYRKFHKPMLKTFEVEYLCE